MSALFVGVPSVPLFANKGRCEITVNNMQKIAQVVGKELWEMLAPGTLLTTLAVHIDDRVTDHP